ncbi:MAG TPA: tetratricopeptide repeat protein [Bacteroidota bacterium]|nr:tetratricopeptide repeat protein [Bacteroidota bacterium]
MTRYVAALVAIVFVMMVNVSELRAQDTREAAEFKLAVRLYNDGLYAQAEEQFASFINRFPNTASAIEARLYLGLLQKQSRNYGAAKSTLQDFALRYQEHPKAPDAWWNLGEVYAAEHNYAEAGQAFAKLKSFHPRSTRAPEALLMASRYFLKVDDTENARTVLNAILLEYPQATVRGEAQFELGRLYLAMGDPERALREFRRLQTETTSQELRARTLAAIGEAHSALGNRTEAEARLKETISLYPKSAAAVEAQVLLGDVQLGFRDYDAAVVNYRASADNATAPQELRVRAFVGLASAQQGKSDNAAALLSYESLFKLVPWENIEPSVVRKAAATARKAGNFTTAQAWLERLFADTLVNVDRRAVLAELGDIAREGRSNAAAVSWYRRYVQQFPVDAGAPFALLRIAEINEGEFRNYTEAIGLYASVVERFGITRVADDAQFARARALEAQGRVAQAAEAYAQLVVQYPASDNIDEAAARISVLDVDNATGNATIDRLTTAIAALQQQSDARVLLLLGQLYLNDLKKYDLAGQAFDDALAKGVSGADAEAAAFGSAMAAIRKAQTGSGDAAEARRRSERYFSAHPSGAQRDELGWALFQLERVNASAADVLTAASRFLALQPATHRESARIASADALAAIGRADEAEKEYTAVIETAGVSLAGAEAWYGRARVRAQNRRFDEALRDLAMVESQAPESRGAAAALLLRGQLLDRVGRYGEAVEIFRRLASRFPYSSLADSARMAEIRALLSAGEMREAVTRSTRYLRDVQDNPFLPVELGDDYLFNHAQTLALARERGAARQVLLGYLETHPDGRHVAEVYYALGQMYKDEGKIDLASSYLQQSANLRNGGEALRDAADLLLESGRFEAAIAQYQRMESSATATAVEKQYARARIVVALYRAGKLAEADKAAADFLSAFKDAAVAADEFALEKGKLYFRQNDYRKAADLFDDVEDSDAPALAALGMYWNGRCLEAQSKNADALGQFENTTKKYPGTEGALEALMSIGRMHMRAEKYQDAAMTFKSVVDAGTIPEAMLKEALNGLIRCYEELNLADAAAEMTKRFLEAYPSDNTAFRKRVNLGVYYYQMRYFDQSITHLEGLLAEASPDDQAEIRYYIGENYYYKNDFNQAALEFLKVPYLVVGKTEIDWTASSYYMAGQSYEKLNRPQLAIEMYQKIINTPGVDARFRAQAEKELARVRALLE